MAKMANTFTIGELSRRAGVKIETIRYYEKSGVMPNPPRTLAGYRMYNENHLKRLMFVRRCRQLGFTMFEIQDLLGLVDTRAYTCGEIQALTLEHADTVSQKIRDLKRLESTLRQISSECSGEKVPQCPIIDALLDPTHQLTAAQS